MSKKSKRDLSKEVGSFLKQYGRKAQKGREPNDRGYDPEVENFLMRLKPEDLDRLINDREDES